MPDDSKLETIPVGSLGIIAHKSIVPLGKKVDSYIVKWRKNRQNENKSSIVFHGYEKDSYLIDTDCPRFGSGEAKGIVNESVRGKDIYYAGCRKLQLHIHNGRSDTENVTRRPLR